MKELIELDSNNYKALFLRSKAYYYQKEQQKALQDIQKALIIEPEN